MNIAPLDNMAWLRAARRELPTPMLREVAAALADHAHDGAVRLSNAALADVAGCSVPLAKEACRLLRRAGLLAEHGSRGGRGNHAEHVLTLPVEPVTEPVTKGVTEPVLEPVTKPVTALVPVVAEPDTTRAIERGLQGLDLNTGSGSLCSPVRPAGERAIADVRDVEMPMSLARVEVTQPPAFPVAAAGVVAAMDSVVAERFGLKWAAKLVVDAQKWAWCEFGYGVVAPGVVPNEPEPALLWLHNTQRGGWDGLEPDASWFDCGCFMSLGVVCLVADWKPGPRKEQPRMARLLMPGSAGNYPVLQRGLERASGHLVERAAAVRAAEARAKGPQIATRERASAPPVIPPPRPEEPDEDVRRRAMEAIFAIGKRAAGPAGARA